MGIITHNLNPPLTYVPWIVIDDVYSAENQQAAERTDLVQLVCRNYKVII